MAAALRMQPTAVLTGPKAATFLSAPPGGVSARQTPPPATTRSRTTQSSETRDGVTATRLRKPAYS
eukprot:8479144-Pyramimonas_sp.AAC.2